MQSKLSISQLEQLVAKYSTKQLAEHLQMSIPKVRELLKENGFTYIKKQWVYATPVDTTSSEEQFGLTEEELLFFSTPQEPLEQSVVPNTEPIQLQPYLVEQLQEVCSEHKIPVEQFVEFVILEAIERLQQEEIR